VDHEHRQRLPDHRPHAEDVQEARAREMMDQLIQLVYLVATALFIFSLKWMSDPATARRGVFAGVGGMALAIIGTLLHPLILNYTWILIPLVLGALLVLPIGGADMPTVISLLNSYAGLAAVAMGFVMENKLLITAGALDGASGLILSIVMCKAMNRSFTNVLFGAFGQVQAGAAATEARTVKSGT